MLEAMPLASLSPDEMVTDDESLMSKGSALDAQHHKENSLFVLDWDDTMLSTSWLSSKGLKLDSVVIPQEVVDELHFLESGITKLLSTCLELGKVAIVTNAESSWVELSSRKFVPRVCRFLPNVRILSARSSYQAQYPDQVGMWKIEAYRCVFREAFGASMRLNGKARFNVVSLGDSIYERNAMLELGKQNPGILAKSVKFVERPTPSQLKKQLEIVLDHLDEVYSKDHEVDLMLEVEFLE